MKPTNGVCNTIRKDIIDRGYGRYDPVPPSELDSIMHDTATGDSSLCLFKAYIVCMFYTGMLVDGGDGIVWITGDTHQ